MPENHITYNDESGRPSALRLWYWRNFCPAKHWIVRFRITDIADNVLHTQDELFLGDYPGDIHSARTIHGLGPILCQPGQVPWKLEIEFPDGERQLLARFDQAA